MAIDFINPNFNMISAIQSVNSSNKANEEAKKITSNGSQSFASALETAVSTLNSQASATAANTNATQQTLTSSKTVDLDAIFQKAADTYGVPLKFLKAVAKAESNFNPTCESHAGAKGIMQLMPGTAKSLGVTNAFDPEQNIMGGAKYLSQQLKRYDGNEVLALAAYNAGPGNVKKYGGVPPFKETQNYIKKVMAYAGEQVSAGQVNLTTNFADKIMAMSSSAEGGSGSILDNVGVGLLNTNVGDMNIKDYELLMDLYRYKMQMTVLTESDSDSDPNSDSTSNFVTNDLFNGITG